MARLLDWLRDPSLDSVDVDATDRFEAHGRILARKTILKHVFTEFHDKFDTLDRRFFTPKGLRVELGAGVAPMRNTYPDVLATDIVASPQLDRALDAEAMDLPDDSVRAIFGQNCFHHFPHPDRFFSELTRVLAPGGGVVLLEPYYGPAAAYMFQRLFKTEDFDKGFQLDEYTRDSLRPTPKGSLRVDGHYDEAAYRLMSESQRKLRGAFLWLGAIPLPSSFRLGQPGGNIMDQMLRLGARNRFTALLAL